MTVALFFLAGFVFGAGLALATATSIGWARRRRRRTAAVRRATEAT